MKMNSEFELNLKNNEDHLQTKISQLKEENEINRKTQLKEMEQNINDNKEKAELKITNLQKVLKNTEDELTNNK